MTQRILTDENINALLSMTAGALTTPQQRAELIAMLEGVLDDVEANGDPDAVAFVNGLCLVAKKGVGVIPELTMPEAYQAPWHAFVAHISGVELPPEQDMFTTIHKNTVLVMRDAPEHKQAWAENIAHNLEMAEAQDDRQMVRLLTAVQALLLDGRVPDMPPQLEGDHQACWRAIVAELD